MLRFLSLLAGDIKLRNILSGQFPEMNLLKESISVNCISRYSRLIIFQNNESNRILLYVSYRSSPVLINRTTHFFMQIARGYMNLSAMYKPAFSNCMVKKGQICAAQQCLNNFLLPG